MKWNKFACAIFLIKILFIFPSICVHFSYVTSRRSNTTYMLSLVFGLRNNESTVTLIVDKLIQFIFLNQYNCIILSGIPILFDTLIKSLILREKKSCLQSIVHADPFLVWQSSICLAHKKWLVSYQSDPNLSCI